ncbi:MAG TPA: putative quinol monooxygenase [Sphingomonas sp.]
MAVKIVAFLSAKPGSEAAVEAAAALVVAGSRSEPGCLRYDLWREPGHGRRYLIDELYVDHAAVDAHQRTPHYASFSAAVADLLESPPAISLGESIDVIA